MPGQRCWLPEDASMNQLCLREQGACSVQALPKAARKVLSPVSTRHIGRQDAAAGDPADRLPAETFTAAQLVESFKRKGFSAQEFVALSGAHTVRHVSS